MIFTWLRKSRSTMLVVLVGIMLVVKRSVNHFVFSLASSTSSWRRSVIDKFLRSGAGFILSMWYCKRLVFGLARSTSSRWGAVRNRYWSAE